MAIANPTFPTTLIGTMKTLGFGFFISTTFLLHEFWLAVEDRAFPEVCVGVQMVLRRTCCVSRVQYQLEVQRPPIESPTVPI